LGYFRFFMFFWVGRGVGIHSHVQYISFGLKGTKLKVARAHFVRPISQDFSLFASACATPRPPLLFSSGSDSNPTGFSFCSTDSCGRSARRIRHPCRAGTALAYPPHPHRCCSLAGDDGRASCGPAVGFRGGF
jgi:hypothetical protein